MRKRFEHLNEQRGSAELSSRASDANNRLNKRANSSKRNASISAAFMSRSAQAKVLSENVNYSA